MDLPPELLAEIFLWYIYGKRLGYEVIFPRLGERGQGPVTLSHVCRAWRGLCLDMPALWACFTVVVRGEGRSLGSGEAKARNSIPRATQKEGKAQLLKEWLKRSKTLPLSIGTADAQEYHLTPVRTLLLEHRYRWNLISLDLTGGFMEDFLRLDPRELTSLQTLFVFSPDVDRPDSRIPDLAIQIGGLTSLRRLTLTTQGGASAAELNALQAIPFENLSHVRIEVWLDLDDTFAILKRCTSAVEVFIGDIGRIRRAEVPLAKEPITLPAIRSLALITRKPLDLLFKAIRLPQLCELYIYDDRPDMRESVMEVDRILKESFGENCEFEQRLATLRGRDSETAANALGPSKKHYTFRLRPLSK